MSRFSVRERQGFPGDDSWLVVWADAPNEPEAVFEDRDAAVEHAEALDLWAARRPLPGQDTGRFLGGVLPFDAVMAALDAIEPSEPVLLSMERDRLLAAQQRLAS